MDFIVLLLIICAISGAVKNSKKNKKGEPQAKSDRQLQRRHQLEEEQRQQEEEQRRREKERMEKQRQLEKRQDELRKAQQKPVTYTKEDILSRSSRDVNEDFREDTLKKEAGLHQGCVEGHYDQQTDLLKTVEDLMILGPNCTISYERDFVGEGERMVEIFK